MINIVIPMAGRGSRFQTAGYTFPKPLIEVYHNGIIKPMIQMVVENINIKGKYIFVVLKEHYEQYSLKYLLPLICKENKCEMVVIDTLTEGAACTILLAESFINNDDELILANSDQWVDWNSEHFLQFLRSRDADGGICTFYATHSRWSFARVEEGTNVITEVAEKKPISNVATVGIYWFKHGKFFVKAAKDMINADDRTNGEFYTCPVFNYMINDNKKILNYPISKMLGTGTPEDLQHFIRMQEQMNIKKS